MKYKPCIVAAFYAEFGIPMPEFEYKFHPTRKWLLDIAWPKQKIALEVQGGIWIGKGHGRPKRMKQDWEKHNAANIMGWKILYFEPSEVCMTDTAKFICQCMGLNGSSTAHGTSEAP